MEKPQTSDPEGTKYFRATYELPSDVDATTTQTLHDAYLQGLHDGRKLRAAGPYVNNPAAGLAILSVPNAERAEEVMQDDPFVKDLGAEYQVIQWDPKFGDFK